MKKILIILFLICLSMINTGKAIIFCEENQQCLDRGFAYCDKSGGALTGVCRNEICTKETENQNCREGYICINGECQVRCKVDADCHHSETCEGAGDRKYCREIPQ